MKLIKTFMLVILAVIALGANMFAQISQDAVITKPFETYQDLSTKGYPTVKLVRDVEVFNIQGVQNATSLSTRQFSLAAYGDSIKFNYSAYDTSNTGNGNLTLILNGYFTPGGTGVLLDTLVNQDSSETQLTGSYTVSGTIYPYYGLKIARASGNPSDAVFYVKIVPIAFTNKQ